MTESVSAGDLRKREIVLLVVFVEQLLAHGREGRITRFALDVVSGGDGNEYVPHLLLRGQVIDAVLVGLGDDDSVGHHHVCDRLFPAIDAALDGHARLIGNRGEVRLVDGHRTQHLLLVVTLQDKLVRAQVDRFGNGYYDVILGVNGFALGGGCEISMACDIRIASDNAKFGQPETGLGILPGFGGTQRLARLVGKGRAKELIFTCDMIDANEAYRIGLANKVVPQAELLDTCKAMAEKIMSKGSYAISLAKEAINTGTETDLSSGLTLEADLFGLAFSTDDKKEGMTAFLEKRKANLTDF